MNARTWYIVLGIALVALGFQFFFRYDYVYLNGGSIMRIDRLTQVSCYMPCMPSPPRTPFVNPTIEPVSLGSSRAIAMTRNFVNGEYFPSGNSAGLFEWNVWRVAANDGKVFQTFVAAGATPRPDCWSDNTCPPPGYARYGTSDIPIHYQVRVVCFCNSNAGWYYEVHLDTGEIFKITGNRDLELRYGFAPPTTHP